jgi:hypothetical protein
LGPEWLPPEGSFRWMPRRATVRLGGPSSGNDRLVLEGFCSEMQLRSGPLHLFVTVDSIPLEGTQIAEPETSFRRLFVMPPSLIGKKVVQVEISVDRTTHVPDGRDLGLVVSDISIQTE